MIGDTANVGVPTHFSKVVLAVKPSSPSAPHIAEMSLGAFVLPNAEIPDETSLESFMIPGKSVTTDAVEDCQLPFNPQLTPWNEHQDWCFSQIM